MTRHFSAAVIAAVALLAPLCADDGINYKTITAGNAHTCALTADGTAYCWGANDVGELGNGTTANASVPTRITGNLRFGSLHAGGQSTCGVTHNGDAYCWGDNSYGQLGTPAAIGTCGAGQTPCSMTPVAVNSTLKFSEVAPGFIASCGLSDAGVAYCWGDNGNGELGIGTFTGPDNCFGRPCSLSPLPVSTDLRFKTISAGAANACAIARSSGALYCWGDGQLDQLGNGTPQPAPATAPVLAAGGLSFAATKIGAVVSCGIAKSGAAYCWGNGIEDGLGTTTPPESCFTQGFGNFPCSSSPNPVMGGLRFQTEETAIGLERTTSCMIGKSGYAYCWGRGDQGQLGNGTNVFSTAMPVRVSGNIEFEAIAVGSAHACGLTGRGDAYCWGANSFGQGGFGIDSANVPMKVASPVE